MTDNKKAILAHIDNIELYARKEGNGWLLKELERRFGGNIEKINEIYEYCIEKIIAEQASQFYKDFPIRELSKQLITDYRRMERYRRQNNFGDFCLAVFQQVENITNWFCHRERFINLYKSKRDGICVFKDKEGNEISIGHLVIQSKYEERKDLDLKKLYFNERLRAVLYFVYFDEKTSRYTFDLKYSEIDKLYQCRNLNHRGGDRNKYQEDTISGILPYKHLYYLKFTGLLVEYVEQISNYMAAKEIEGRVTKVLPGAVIIELSDGERIVVDKGRMFYKVKDCKENDLVCIERNRMNKEILNIKRIN